MNPFTRFLRSLRPEGNDPAIERFVEWWDMVETVVVSVSKRGMATLKECEAYAQARTALLADYDEKWAPRFAPHWPKTLEAGRATPSDPFRRILAPESADGFVDNWAAMQALAAARETVNRYILSLDS